MYQDIKVPIVVTVFDIDAYRTAKFLPEKVLQSEEELVKQILIDKVNKYFNDNKCDKNIDYILVPSFPVKIHNVYLTNLIYKPNVIT